MGHTVIEMQYMDTIRRELPKVREALERIADAVAPAAPDLTGLTNLVTEARRAADSDSNDYEIESLQAALGVALNMVPGWKDPS